MKIETRTIRAVHILDCSGEMTAGHGTIAVRKSVGDILKIGGKKIALNLAAAKGIDIPGVDEPTRTYTTLVDQGGS